MRPVAIPSPPPPAEFGNSRGAHASYSRPPRGAGMRPVFVAWLEQHGLGRLAGLVPTPGLMYAAVVLGIGAAFLLRVRNRGIGWERGLEAVLAASIGAGIGTRLFYLIVSGDLDRAKRRYQGPSFAPQRNAGRTKPAKPSSWRGR